MEHWLTLMYYDWDVIKFIAKIIGVTILTWFLMRFVWKHVDWFDWGGQ